MLALVLLAAGGQALAEDCVADLGGVLDGNVTPVPPSQIQVDGICRILNYPNGMSTNFSFLTQPGQTQERWIIIFDNVVHTGQMACNAVAGHKIWFVNGSSSTIQQNCQNLLIPVEKIDKANPPGPSAVTIGVPFTYRLTIPVLFDPATGQVINFQGSINDLHGITVWDNLNETGVDLTYVSHTVTWETSGTPVPHTFTNVGGVLTFDNIPIVPAESQFFLDITVVLEDTPTNAPGTQFVNRATWDFGRLIDGVFYEPLPGEWGISPPLTIAAPQLVVAKTGPTTLGRTLNLGQWGQFGVDVHNTGLTPAWDVRILDRLPDGPTGGMCNQTPEIVSAQVFAADGVTPVPGKGALVAGTDYTFSYVGAPVCELTLNLRTAAASIAADERLVINYRTKLDADTQDGVALTNVVGATQWFNDDDTNPARITYTRTLTNGTVGVADHEDAHTVTTALYGFFFEKSVANMTSGANPATTAEPGDVLRYTLRLQSTDVPLDDLAFTDDLGAMNPSAVFVPGSLTLVGSLPPGANASATNPSGGTNGAGLLDVRNIDLAAFSQASVQFDITLAPRIQNGTVVTNQADLLEAAKIADSDDPNVNGQADPDIVGDEDPTRVTIVSAPYFDIDKISADIDGDATLLLAGERLQYTITVRNTGTSDATDAVLRDAVPANTAYVAGSTTLNGAPVADGAGGTSPLANGILITTPGAATPGLMPVAAVPASPQDTATIVFVVRVDAAAVDGTVISNQGFVSAPNTNVFDRPSDDPRTPTLDDPTRDIVGAVPFLFAVKSAALQVDALSPGIVDPGDVLRYTITIYNNGRQPATEVVLRDTVPANTTYVADTLTLNGLPVGRPDGGVSPLIAGVSVSSSDRTPPLPGAGQGVLTEGQSAVVTFDLLVDNGVPPGTLIANQAVVDTGELPDLLTDGDGNPATGPEPTVVVVGDVQQLRITKNVAVVGGGPALPGAMLEYVVQATNIGAVPAYQVVIRDDLDATPGQLAYVAGSATMNGSANGVVVTGQLLEGNYSTVYGPLEPGRTITFRFRATLYSNLAVGTRVTNTGTVYWNDPVQTASASVSIDVGGIPGVGLVNGRVWHDTDFDDVYDAGETALAGWDVELLFNGSVAHVARTAPDGVYRMSGVVPNYNTTDTYELRFIRPGAGARTALLGEADSEFTNALQRITDIVVMSGSNLQDLNLPIDPNGIVYDSISRAALAGATVSLVAPGSGTPLPAACFYDANQQGQVTLADGWYKFDLNFADPACPTGGAYLISVVPPSSAYLAQVSTIIPPRSSAATAAFAVPTCPASIDDAVPATAQHCEATASQLQPPASVPAGTAGTVYHLHLLFDDSFVPGTSQIFNNHIPLDLDLDESISVTKTTPLVHVSRGQLVPYIITLTNGVGVNLPDVTVIDRFPAGFRYVENSARLDGVPAEPTLVGRELSWSGLTVTPDGRHELKLLLAVGSGVGEGEFVNRAQAMSALTGGAVSAEASATVRIVPDPALDCTDVIGKVFDDANRSGVQDEGERGIPGVRLATARGLLATTDQHGRFHITCAITPHEGRGTNFVLKLDDRTLPSGYRGSTQSLQVQRATRGKMLEFSFGASIHRVIGLDLADAVFEPGSTVIRDLWQPRLELLLEELRAAPAVLRLSYLADLEDPQLVDARLKALRRYLDDAWHAQEGGGAYELAIEPEVFWRRGEPTEARERRRGDRP